MFHCHRKFLSSNRTTASIFLLKERERVRETKNDEFLLEANLTIIILIIIIIIIIIDTSGQGQLNGKQD